MDTHDPDIATPNEVLATFTQLMRGEKSSEQLKAAEQLAKYHSLFTVKDEGAIRPEVIEQVERAVQRLMHKEEPDADPIRGSPRMAADPPG